MKSEKKFVIFSGNIVHSIGPSEIELIENGFIIVEETKIVAIGASNDLETCKANLNIKKFHETKLKPSQLLIPGFIDTHIHAVQYPNCGLGYDKPLLEWLNDYTYPMEKQMKNEEFAERVFDAVVNRTLSNGTTTAMYFASLYEHISLLLVESVIKHGQRALVGKINMTVMAPTDYVESENDSIKKTIQFVNKVKKLCNPLVHPVITPRFALSVDMPVMKTLGKIAREEDLHIQTHISENANEVELVERIFGRKYAEVYDEAGLLTPKTILAHGIHLSESEIDLIAERGASISHCPESNCLLRSGICKVKKLMDREVDVCLGTDVSGGASPSMINAMRAAISSSINSTFVSNEKCECIDWKEAFYLATLGGARALRMENQIGNFEKGKEFDALIVDLDVKDSACDYLLTVSPMENLQKFIFTGDDRNILNVFVAGKQVRCYEL
ncbi:guanine deaminase [Coccinella septempunctata]|uniref:guanine deaminase n=1 Tax=Coccinella septempunctata TaxID=41139 RepID=UPI001D08B64B|nr:guanine deaminase [Coccinella septempunctata]